MMRLLFLLGGDAHLATRTELPSGTSHASHRLAHALAGGTLRIRGMSLHERTVSERQKSEAAGFGNVRQDSEFAERALVFAAIVTDVSECMDEIAFAAALRGADGRLVGGRRCSGTWTQPPRRLMRLVFQFSVDPGFVPVELGLMATGSADETVFRLAIRAHVREDGSRSYD